MKTINEYLMELDRVMLDFDPATRQDALADAEDHLRNALAEAVEANPESTEEELLPAIVEGYGTPQETADAYGESETRFAPVMTRAAKPKSDNILVKIFGIFVDPTAWGALLYSLVAFVTGTVFFSWVVAGVSTSIGLSILIIGLPVAMLFFMSFLGIGFLEGRMVEALLGVRMPRRQRFFDTNMSLMDKIKRVLLGGDTWLTVLYMIVMYPVKVFSFCVTVTLIATGVALMLAPGAQFILNIPMIQMGGDVYMLPGWLAPFVILGGFLLLTASMHFIRWFNVLIGKAAKAMLVTK